MSGPTSLFGSSRITDVALCGTLDTCLSLSKAEHAVVEAAMAQFVERGTLSKKTRDQLMAMAQARGLFRKTAVQPKKREPMSLNDGTDAFSSKPGTIAPEAAKQITWLGGSMPVPPIRRAI